eukprot:7525482-Prorocentrum_lima.AAC.1
MPQWSVAASRACRQGGGSCLLSGGAPLPAALAITPAEPRWLQQHLGVGICLAFLGKNWKFIV